MSCRETLGVQSSPWPVLSARCYRVWIRSFKYVWPVSSKCRSGPTPSPPQPSPINTDNLKQKYQPRYNPSDRTLSSPSTPTSSPASRDGSKRPLIVIPAKRALRGCIPAYTKSGFLPYSTYRRIDIIILSIFADLFLGTSPQGLSSLPQNASSELEALRLDPSLRRPTLLRQMSLLECS